MYAGLWLSNGGVDVKKADYLKIKEYLLILIIQWTLPLIMQQNY